MVVSLSFSPNSLSQCCSRQSPALNTLNIGFKTCYTTTRSLVIETFPFCFFFKCFGCRGEIGSSEWPADEAAGALMNRTLIAGSPRCKLPCLPPLTTGNYRAAAADTSCIFIAPAGHIDQQLT